MMQQTFRRAVGFLFWVMMLSSVGYSNAEPTRSGLPEGLKPWVAWVAERHPEFRCGLVAGARRCDWPGKIDVAVDSRGGSFRFFVSLDTRGQVALPGGDGFLPLEVVALQERGQFSPRVVLKNKRPVVELDPGNYELRGIFAWTEAPESLLLPANIGIVTLSKDGAAVVAPKLTESGSLFLGRENRSEEQQVVNRLVVEVYRELKDELPFQVTTVLRLQVAGRVREVSFGRVTPEGGATVSIDSQLETKFSNQQELSVEVRPGNFDVQLVTVFPTPPRELKMVPGSSHWPRQEYWVWRPNELLRTVKLVGGTPIDASQTNLPDMWRNQTTRMVQENQVVTMETERRGEVRVAGNELNIERRLWLDLDGAGYTAQDAISGVMNRDWRLNAGKNLELGRVVDAGIPQLITKDSVGGFAGVELRQQSVSLVADSRLTRSGNGLAAHGWDTTFKNLGVTLALPPGWTLLGVGGADSVSDSWVASWSLLDIFLVLLCAAVIGRVVGIRWGCVALIGLMLAHTHPGTPRFAWIHFVGAAAVAELVTSSGLKRFFSFYAALTGILIAAMLVDFSISEARVALYPGVFSWASSSDGFVGYFANLVEQSIFGWSVAVVLAWAVVVMVTHHFIKGFLLLVGAAAVLVVAFGSVGDTLRQQNLGSQALNMSQDFADKPAAAPQYLGKQKRGEMQAFSKLAQDSVAGSAPEEAERGDGAVVEEPVVVPEGVPAAVIQTGAGVPNWNWREHRIEFQGNVGPSHQISLWLVSPFFNVLLTVIRVCALGLLLLPFLVSWRKLWRQSWLVSSLSIFIVLCSGVLGIQGDAQAQSFPQPEILKELEQRLEKEVCREQCATYQGVKIGVVGRKVSYSGLVVAADGGSVQLPGPMSVLGVERILIDGRESKRIRRDEQGYLWVRFEAGAHQLVVEGEFLRGDNNSLQFPMSPSALAVEAPEWSVVGVGRGGGVDGVVEFTRKAGPVPGSALKPEINNLELEFAPWFLLTRRIEIGVQWRVVNTLTRVGGHRGAVKVEVPQVNGETITADRIDVSEGLARVSLGAGELSRRWDSRIAEQPELGLKASTNNNVSESWVVVCSVVSRCVPAGLSPVQSIQQGVQAYLWRPYPGDAVQIGVVKPGSAAGQTMTIDSVQHTVVPGLRETEGSLEVSARSSQGGVMQLELPAAATVAAITVNGRDDTTRSAGQNLMLTLQPGENSLFVRYTVVDQPEVWWRPPAVVLSDMPNNVTTAVTWGQNRWVWWLSGAQWGPSVLFWSRLLVVVVLAGLVAWFGVTPLKFGDWVLLGLGTAALSVESFLVPLVWLTMVGLRSTWSPDRRWIYNVSQIFLVIGGLITIAVLYEAVRSGLILQPDMGIAGNGSNNNVFRWYQDRSGKELLLPVVVSAPMWLWRVCMLGWSVWLVVRLLSWGKWVGRSLMAGGGWR